MKKFIHLFSTCRIGCSDVAGDYFFNDDRYLLVYNGIDVDKYHVDRTPHCRGLAFIAVGRLSPQKNPLKIVEIFSEIRKREPNASLVWLGDGSMRDEVKNMIKKLGLENSIQLMGVQRDVVKFLKKADFYLLPSLFEGLSLSLAEAQAAGLICFVSDTCSRLSDCGLCSYIPLKYSSEEWAEQICECTKNSENFVLNRNEMAKFDIKTTARILEKVYLN